ncbi:MAG TPA: hypothetical protein VGL53_24555 [Bryobacteraceae bacterium]
MRAEIGDRESDLGRALNEDELSAILKRRGDPVRVASRYLELKPLIGPALLPVYWFVVKLVTLWILVPCFALIIGPIEVARSANPGLAWGATVWNLFMGQVFVFGIITLVFVLIERSDVARRAFDKSADEWDPRTLPSLPASKARQSGATPRSTAITEVVTGLITALAVLTFLWSPLEVRFDQVLIVADPIWNMLRWPLLGMGLATMALGWFSLVRPFALREREWFRIAIDAANLILIGILMLAGQWVTFHATNLTDALYEVSRWSNLGIRIGLGLGALITGYSLVDKVLNLTRLRARTMPSQAL